MGDGKAFIVGVKTSRPPFRPTEEQQAIIDRVQTGDSIKVEALAGTGKTSTLEAVGRACPTKSMLYVCFNRSVAEEARQRMPSNVEPRTAHSLAWQSVGQHYKHKQVRSVWSVKLGLASLLGPMLREAAKRDEAAWLFAVLDTITRFQWSPDAEIGEAHIPEQRRALGVDLVLKLAKAAWAAMGDRSLDMPITDDGYLKLWQLKRPTLRRDVLLFDEAQDANPVMLDVVRRHLDTQTVYVGDANQQIYAWRGAVDALSSLAVDALPLTQSWRFGSAIATTANQILEAKGSPLRVRGMAGEDRVFRGPGGEAPDVVLARTNAGLVADALELADSDYTIAAVGGLEVLVKQIEAAYELYTRGRTGHPAFKYFATWAELEEAAESDNGQEYRPFVTLVRTYRQSLPDVCRRLRAAERPEGEADVLLCTVHRFKGKEGGHVRLSDDLRPFVEEQMDGTWKLLPEEANIDYVAVTRAKQTLDLGGFAEALALSIAKAPKRDGKPAAPVNVVTSLPEPQTSALRARLQKGIAWLDARARELDALIRSHQTETPEYQAMEAAYRKQVARWLDMHHEYAQLTKHTVEVEWPRILAPDYPQGALPVELAKRAVEGGVAWQTVGGWYVSNPDAAAAAEAAVAEMVTLLTPGAGGRA